MVQGHAYSVISVHEFEAHGKLVRLLMMRNPWGRGEWDGAWSDKSDLWTPEISEQLGHTDEDDGVFFIPIEDYITHFDSTTVSIMDSSNKPISMASYEKDETAFF